MIQPKQIEINGKPFTISKFTATGGREIVTQYVASGMPKLGDYKRNEELMLKLMCYVAIDRGTELPPLRLTTQSLVDNHVGDWETLTKLEMAMMEYNCSFFQDGRLSTFFEDTAQKVQAWISKTLTALLERLSQTAKPPSTN